MLFWSPSSGITIDDGGSDHAIAAGSSKPGQASLPERPGVTGKFCPSVWRTGTGRHRRVISAGIRDRSAGIQDARLPQSPPSGTLD